MRYISTRDNAESVQAAEAIVRGMVPQGGLYVPQEIPQLDEAALRAMVDLSYQALAKEILALYLDDFSAEEISTMVDAAYDASRFDDAEVAPVVKIHDGLFALELWHGPTAAFKDMALQLLPHLLVHSMKKTGVDKEVVILVATSGDTGKAALEGFCDEVDALGCQFSSANSINWGRLLPQIVYYFAAYMQLVRKGEIAFGDAIDFTVPTGNFGNILAGWFAREMGLPIGKLVCASNANDVLDDFIRTGTYDANRPFMKTNSPSMDILISSNLERLLSLLSGSDEEVRGYMQKLSETGTYTVSDRVLRAVQAEFSCGFCTDAQGAQTIGKTFRESRYLLDTHTAVACTVLGAYRAETGDQTLTVVESTASPFKFCASVLDALGVTEHAPGTGVLGQLTAETGRPAPTPLASLAGKPVRFDQVTDRGDMRAVVTEFLR